MNRLVSTLSRNLACGAAAALITLVLSITFVQSTALPPGARADGNRFFALGDSQPHAWLGLPQPAVLVD
jgi:hypothetical protein